MKYDLFLIGLLSAMTVSCSVNEIVNPEKESFDSSNNVVYAVIADTPGDTDTKVYADSKLRVLWNEDDCISYFAKTTYNGQYLFLGEDGDNAGSFAEIPNSNPHTGNDVSNHYAVYPYQLKTSLTNDEIIRFTLPAEQTYKKDSFGIGANTMASKTPTNELKFKNVGGYLSFKFYGEGISVSSITLKGNNGEKLAGKCTIDMSSGEPAVSMDQEKATEEITLTCDPPVSLGSSSSDYVEFWMVVPPITFSKGITFTVATPDGKTWEKQTTASFSLPRNVKRSLPALEVIVEDAIQPNRTIYYTSVDGEVISGEFQYANGYLSNEYTNEIGCITFSEDITSIGECWFQECKKLLTIILPDSVVNLESGSFQNCSSLLSINIPDGVTSIGDYAFDGCKSLNSVAVPQNLISIGGSAFSACSGLTAFILPESLVSIGDGAFAYSGLQSVTIPNFVTSIGEQSFQDCSDLKEVILSNSVSSIGDWAFCGTGITSISIPNSVTTVGQYAFSDCPSLTSVFISSSEMSIGERAFDNINLESVEISGGITTIGERAFYHYGGNALSTVLVSNAVLNVGVSSFEECLNLTSINTNNSIINAGNKAFYNCSGLNSIDFSDVHSIGGSSFKGCVSLTSISLSDNVTSIGSGAFSGCSGLTSVVIPDSVTSIGVGAFSGCTGLSSITIPDSVTNLENRLFYGCNNLMSVKLPNTMASVGDYFFYNCENLVSIDFPSTLSSIGFVAFSNCNSLTSLVFRSITPPDGQLAMFSDSSCPIYVPAESVETYKSAQYWSDYADRIQAIQEINGHAYVDMGNGLKWATMNVGASSETEYGDYFAWGEIKPKSSFSWNNYAFIQKGQTSYLYIEKYQTDDHEISAIWYGGQWTSFIGDNKVELEPEDDAAAVLWQSSWRIPTYNDWEWLNSNCTWTWDNEKKGYLVESKVAGFVGNSIFLPSGGNGWAYAGTQGSYWSSSLCKNATRQAYKFMFNSTQRAPNFVDRSMGGTIRPVSD